jgi:hypothetical protein
LSSKKKRVLCKVRKMVTIHHYYSITRSSPRYSKNGREIGTVDDATEGVTELETPNPCNSNAGETLKRFHPYNYKFNSSCNTHTV